MSQGNGTTPGTCGLGASPKRSPALRARDTYSFRFGQSGALCQLHLYLPQWSIRPCLHRGQARCNVTAAVTPKKREKRKKKHHRPVQSPTDLFLFSLILLPFLPDGAPMTMLATRLSLTAATAIGRFYDPSTRNGPAPLCRDPSLLCELCPSKNSPSRAMLTPSAGPSANAAADSRHKATSSVFSSGCGCRSSANHTPRSRRISGSRTTLPRPPSALRRGKPRVGVYSTQSRRDAARQTCSPP